MYTYIYIYIYTHASLSLYMFIYTYMYIIIDVYIYVYIYIYIHYTHVAISIAILLRPCVHARMHKTNCACIYACTHARMPYRTDECATPEPDSTDTDVCAKTILQIGRQAGQSASRTPNLGLDRSFCSWVAWPRLK